MARAHAKIKRNGIPLTEDEKKLIEEMWKNCPFPTPIARKIGRCGNSVRNYIKELEAQEFFL
jgi:hypothetical protein